MGRSTCEIVLEEARKIVISQDLTHGRLFAASNTPCLLEIVFFFIVTTLCRLYPVAFWGFKFKTPRLTILIGLFM